MADGKELKFRMVVDEASIQKTRQLVRDLIGDFQKLQQAMGGQGGGGGSGGGLGALLGGGANVHTSGATTGSPEQAQVIAKTAPAGRGLVQTFLDQKNIFKGIADGSKDSLKMMSDSLHQAIDYQKREIKDLDNAAAHLAETYRNMGKEIAELKSVTGGRYNPVVEEAEDEQRGVGADHAKLVAERAERKAEFDRLNAMKSGGGEDSPAEAQGGGSAKGGALNKALNALGLGKYVGALKGFGAAGVGLVGAGVLADDWMGAANAQQTFRAQRNKIVSPAMGGIASGDFSWGGAAIRAGMQDGTFFGNAADAGAGTAGTVSSLVHGVFGTIKQIKDAVTGGGVNGAGSIVGGDLTPQGLRNAQIKNVMNAVSAQHEAFTPAEQMAMSTFYGNASGRLGAQRILGIGSMVKDPKTGQFTDPYTDRQAALTERGYDLSSQMASFTGMRSLAGRDFARRFSGANMAAEAAGYGGFGAMGAAAARAGGLGSANDFAYGAVGGGIDRSAGIQLGQAIQGNGFDLAGTTNGMGTLAAAQNGMGFSGDTGDFNRVGRTAAGLQFGNAIVGGGMSPYQAGANMLNAVRLAPDAGFAGQDFLANGMTMKQMLDITNGDDKSDISQAAQAFLGGDYKDKIKKQMTSSIASTLDAMPDQGGRGVIGGVLKKWHAFEANGGDIQDFSRTLEGGERHAFAYELGRTGGVGMEAAEGLMGLTEGAGSSVKKGRIGAGAPKGALADTFKAQADVQRQIGEALKGLGDLVGGSATASALLFGKLDDISKNSEKGASELAAGMKDLAHAILNDIAVRQGRPLPFPPEATPAAKASAAATKIRDGGTSAQQALVAKLANDNR